MTENSPSVKRVLAGIEREGVESEREQLLLWVVRNQFGIGVEDSYSSILSQREIFPGVEVDAVVVTTRRDLVSPIYVLFDDSGAGLRARATSLLDALRTTDAPEAQLAKANSQLRTLFEPATDRRVVGDVSRLVLCVSPSDITGRIRTNLNQLTSDVAEIEVVDKRFLDALAEADAAPTAAMPLVSLDVDPSTILPLGMRRTEAVITPISAEQIAGWDGIADRRLFDLNVRYALGLNRVRRSLDSALRDPDSADEFIAFHNGITATCSDFRVTSTGLEIEGLSVVNGAQTVVAIFANANAGHLAPGIRVLLKLVKASPESELANNIAVRSNTQNPVTSRNLRALDDVQARLQAELGDLGYAFTRRPNDQEPSGRRVIRNDDAAQWLCSIYARKPALAVKRQVLFEEPLYGEVFPSDLDAARVVFASMLRQQVEKRRGEVPEEYQRRGP